MTSIALEKNGNSESSALDMRDYLRILGRYWLASTAIVLLFVLAGAAWTMTQPRVYTSSASGLVHVPAGGDTTSAYAADALAKSQAQSFVELARSLSVAKAAAQKLGAGDSPASLLGRVTAMLPVGTAVIDITATGPTPSSAANLADAWISAMAQQITKLQTTPGALSTNASTFDSLASGSIPTRPTSPDVPLALLLAALAGIVVGVAHALVRNLFDRRIREATTIERRLGTPVLGAVPLTNAISKDQRLIAVAKSDNHVTRQAVFAMAESLRELRTNLSYVDVDNSPRVIVVTSPQSGDGKSTIAANLAEALASASAERVVAIDCDLRRPTLASIFHVSGNAGLTDVLSGRARLEDVLQPAGSGTNLWLLASGRIPPNPSELLGSRAMKDMLEALREHAIVILDAPPILSVTDAAVLSPSTDGVLVVASARRTTYDQLHQALQLIKRGGGHVLGTVLNRVPTKGNEARAYGYYGGDYYREIERSETPNERSLETAESGIDAASPSLAAHGSARELPQDATLVSVGAAPAPAHPEPEFMSRRALRNSHEQNADPDTGRGQY